MPVLLVMFAGAIVVAQAMNQKTTAQFVAEVCAAIGRGVLNQPNNGGLPAVQTAAQNVFNANAGLWLFNASPQLASVTLDQNGNVVCTVTASSAPLFPLPGFGTLNATATATD